MNKVLQKWKIIYELLGFLIAALIAFTLTFFLQDFISPLFYRFLWIALFMLINYFRWIVWTRHSIILQSVYVKAILFIANIPFFFWLYRQYMVFVRSFDNYIYSYATGLGQPIHASISMDNLSYLKTLTIFSGSIALFFCILFSVRLVWVVFKYREIPENFIH